MATPTVHLIDDTAEYRDVDIIIPSPHSNAECRARVTWVKAERRFAEITRHTPP